MPQPTDDPTDGLVRPLSQLKPKGQQPKSVAILNQWIAHAERSLGVPAAGGRMGWLVASTVVIAALQQAVDHTGTPSFLLKGGTMLQHRLGLTARATSDIDGLIRGDIARFVVALDDVLAQSWEPFTMTRSEVEVVDTPTRVVKPRRLTVSVSLRGQMWRKVQVELAPDEGGAGDTPETVGADADRDVAYRDRAVHRVRDAHVPAAPGAGPRGAHRRGPPRRPDPVDRRPGGS